MSRVSALVLFFCAANAGAQVQAGKASVGNVNVGDAAIHYESIGRGKAVVFLHGWSQDLGIWGAQAAAFAPRYRVIRVDSRGFGRSGGFADESADPDDLRILLDSLGIRSAIVVGLSRGADVALRFAVNFPTRVDGVVLYGVSHPLGFQPPPAQSDKEFLAMLSQFARAHGLDSLGKMLFASPGAWMPPDRHDLQDTLRKSWARYKGRDLLDPRPESGRVPPVRLHQVNGIRVPTLIVHGDHEMPELKVVADTLARRIPNARKVVIANGGHGAHFAQPEQFNKALADFFYVVATRR